MMKLYGKNTWQLYKFIFSGIVLLAISVLFSSCNSANSVAKQGLKAFKAKLNNSNYKLLGLDSLQQGAGLKLGEPIPVLLVLPEAISIHSATHSDSILTDIHRLIYPILSANGKLLSTEEIQLINNKWQLRTFGAEEEVAYYLAKKGIMTNNSIPKTSLIRVPSLLLNFIGGKQGNSTKLLFLESNPYDSISPNKLYDLNTLVGYMKFSASLHTDGGVR